MCNFDFILICLLDHVESYHQHATVRSTLQICMTNFNPQRFVIVWIPMEMNGFRLREGQVNVS